MASEHRLQEYCKGTVPLFARLINQPPSPILLICNQNFDLDFVKPILQYTNQLICSNWCKKFNEKCILYFTNLQFLKIHRRIISCIDNFKSLSPFLCISFNIISIALQKLNKSLLSILK